MNTIIRLRKGVLGAAGLVTMLLLGCSECRAQSPAPLATGKYAIGGVITGDPSIRGFEAPAVGGTWYLYRGGTLGFYFLLWDNTGSVFIVEPVDFYGVYVRCSYYGYVYYAGQYYFREDGFLYYNETTGSGGYGPQYIQGLGGNFAPVIFGFAI